MICCVTLVAFLSLIVEGAGAVQPEKHKFLSDTLFFEPASASSR